MKTLARIILIGYAILVIDALALTPAERKVVQQAQTELRAGKADYAQAKNDLSAADQKAADAVQHAKDTDLANKKLTGDIKEYADRADALAKQNVKMKLVFDECTKWFSLGAFVYGFKELAKHVMWFAIGGIGLVAVLYGLSFAFPVIGLGLSIVVRFFTFIFHGLNTALRALEAHLKSKA